jgi:hypothetical protein
VLTERFNAAQRHHDTLFGIVASVVANFGFRAPRDPATPADFIPGLRTREEEADEEQIAESMHRYGQAQKWSWRK